MLPLTSSVISKPGSSVTAALQHSSSLQQSSSRKMNLPLKRSPGGFSLESADSLVTSSQAQPQQQRHSSTNAKLIRSDHVSISNQSLVNTSASHSSLIGGCVVSTSASAISRQPVIINPVTSVASSVISSGENESQSNTNPTGSNQDSSDTCSR